MADWKDEAAREANQVDMGDFAAAVTTGVLRALAARKAAGDDLARLKRTIWAGFWIGDDPGPSPFRPDGNGGPGS